MKRIKISQIGQFAKGKYERLIEVAVAETYKSLVQKSPVLTGRFKASWAVGQNDESYVGQPPGKIGYNKEKAGNIHSVYNNLPYGEKLETAPVGQGGSKKTNGPGWIRATGKRIQRLMPTLAKQVEVE